MTAKVSLGVLRMHGAGNTNMEVFNVHLGLDGSIASLMQKQVYSDYEVVARVKMYGA